MKKASHKNTPAAANLRLVSGVGLVDLSHPDLPERLAGKVGEQLEVLAAQMRHGLLAASVAIGLDVMGELMEAEVIDVAGPKGRHNRDRTAYRHGCEDAKDTLGGRRIAVKRSRVRSVAGGDAQEGEIEIHLESYDTFTQVDLLSEHMVASMLAGLSTRRYRAGLVPVGGSVETAASGISQTTVSRRFCAMTAERLAEFRTRPLDDQRSLICFVDGFDFADHTMVGALGVTADGTKVPLGVVHGSTENANVVKALLAGLRDRGLDATEGILFVLDGGKALHKAVRDVFGDHAVIARCRTHKERNVMDHLVEAERPWVRRKLRAAWVNPDAGEAEAALKALAGQLERVNPDAAASLRCLRLGRRGGVRRRVQLAACSPTDPKPAHPTQLDPDGPDGPDREPIAPARPSHASLPRRKLRRQDPRQRPSAVVPHAGICAGGRPRGRSLPPWTPGSTSYDFLTSAHPLWPPTPPSRSLHVHHYYSCHANQYQTDRYEHPTDGQQEATKYHIHISLSSENDQGDAH